MESMQRFEVLEAKGVVLVVHGSGEHIGRYHHVAKWFNQQKLIMVGGDLPGLGSSKEKKGHIDHFDDYLRKVDQWLENAKEKWPSLPIFIYGHSMGGLIVLRYIQELKRNDERIKGIILTSPALSVKVEVPNWQIKIAQLLHSFWPSFTMKSNIQPYHVSRDPEVIAQYAKDPLVYNKVSIRWFFQFQEAIQYVWSKKERLNQLQIPILLLQAGEDLLVNPEKATKYVADIDSRILEYHLIPELYHEILNEPEKEIYLDLITNWINKYI